MTRNKLEYSFLILVAFGTTLYGCEKSATTQPDANHNANTETEEKPAPAATSMPSNIQFRSIGSDCGIDFVHAPHRTEERYTPETIGSGVIVADFNNDDAADIVLINGGIVFDHARPDDAKNRLYLNDGTGKFVDATDEWKLPSIGYGMGGAAGDFDNDGWTDLFLTGFGESETLLRNTGKGFIDVTASAGPIRDGEWSTSAGFFDADADGDLDLFIVRYVAYAREDALPCHFNNVRVYCTPVLFDAVPDKLLRNRGDGTFEDVSIEAGIAGDAGKGLALGIVDIDHDGDQDVYVANDTTRNQLWINDGNGYFEDQAILLGVAYSKTGSEEAGMGVDFTDLAHNGHLAIACANFEDETTALYRQNELGVFSEVSDAIGIGQSARERLSFGLRFFDADNDGDDELLVANGHIEDNVSLRSSTTSFAQQNTLYENRGDGTFKDISDSAGDALLEEAVSRGVAIADFDRDGKLDFVVTNNGGPVQIARNETKNQHNYVSFSLRPANNRSPVGTRIAVTTSAGTVERSIVGTNSFLSQSAFSIHFGLGRQAVIENVTVYWPDGSVEKRESMKANIHHVLRQQEST